jgi:hypothetical protein
LTRGEVFSIFHSSTLASSTSGLDFSPDTASKKLCGLKGFSFLPPGAYPLTLCFYIICSSSMRLQRSISIWAFALQSRRQLVRPAQHRAGKKDKPSSFLHDLTMQQGKKNILDCSCLSMSGTSVRILAVIKTLAIYFDYKPNFPIAP